MNANTKLWVEALRSGEYKQTTGRLRATTGECCCLGVACEVALKQGVDLKVEVRNGHYQYNNEGGSLPSAVQKWIGLTSPTGYHTELPAINGRHELTGYNDTGVSFNEIADIIEQNQHLLFYIFER